MPVTDLPIIGFYNQQRFKQFDPSDCCNWYIVTDEIGKKKAAMYPTMGRAHIRFLNQNRLIFDEEPRALFKTINYWYAVVNNTILRIDKFYNQVEITSTTKLLTLTGNVFFTTLVAGTVTFACFVDSQKIYIYREDTGQFAIVTDTNAPGNGTNGKPGFIAAFGNRITVSIANTNTFVLSEINLEGTSFNPATCFTISSAQVFAQESGIIRQMGVLQNTLYIFTDYTTGIWSNIPSSFISAGGVQTSFPWKKNTTTDWDFGMADPNSLDIDFGQMTWLAKNRSGLIQVMTASTQRPDTTSTEAIDVLLQRISNEEKGNPFLEFNADGFLYDYENTVFYRLSAGVYDGSELIDQVSSSNSIEFNYRTGKWHRCIEKNGERNRIKKHVFFNNHHFVTLEGDNTVYEMSGQFYTNEITNPDQTDRQATDAYIKEPFRYERVTPIICAGLVDVLVKDGAAFYDEFITDYVEIDFVWGEQTFINSTVPYEDAVFIVDEETDSDNNPIYLTDEEDSNTFIIGEEGNLPALNSPQYHVWYKPHIELYFSDDGGISFQSADVREFSQLGVFQWRMRWYQLGPSRNRVYRLVCVSPSPIVILGANMDVRRASGGAS